MNSILNAQDITCLLWAGVSVPGVFSDLLYVSVAAPGWAADWDEMWFFHNNTRLHLKSTVPYNEEEINSF